jgi:drug/metabolite transporter (DMT)-like permease
VTVVFWGCLAGVLLGAVNVAARLAMRRFPDVELGGFVMAAIALPILVVVTAASGVDGDELDAGELWPYFVTGMLVPGASQILWVRALRDAGVSRAAVAMGVAPLFSVLIAVAFLDEPFSGVLAAGTLLVVAGGVTFAWEKERPPDFKMIGIVLALVGALMQAGRDNAVRGLSKGDDVDPLVAATTMVAGAVLLLLAYVVVTRREQLRLPVLRRAFLPWLPCGLFMAAIYVTFLHGLGVGPVTVFVPLAGTNALWSVLLAYLVFGRSEAVGRHLVLSATLVVAGGALIGVFR